MSRTRAEYQREWRARQKAMRTLGALPCPECGALRRNPETLHAHRGIAHGRSVLPGPEAP